MKWTLKLCRPWGAKLPKVGSAWPIFAAAIAILAYSAAEARQPRSHAVLAEFQAQHPCPSTGLKTGKCPGWIKDHIVALACGGPDSVENLQWQTVQDAKAKDRVERKDCEKTQNSQGLEK